MLKSISIFLILTCAFLFGCNQVNNVIPPTNDNTHSSSNDDRNEIIYLSSKVNSLCVRSAPNSTSKVIGYLDKGDIVEQKEVVGEYYKTIYKETTAYVHNNYVTSISFETSSEMVEKAISTATTLLGYPYVWGSQRYHWGNGKLNKNYVHGEYDCSAFVQYVYFVSNDIKLDLTSRTQANAGIHVDKSEIRRGDLLFFTNASRKNLSGIERIGHVGIYFGNNYILHTASDHAVIEPISNIRWNNFITARRVI